MLEILRDQVWEFVGGVFLGLVAIVVSIFLWWTQRRRKALSYEIISRTSLLSIEDEIKGKLEIFFDGKPVQDVHLIVFKIVNSGNVPIVSTDYERPVSLTFGENPQILSAEVSETNPDNLRASVDIEATRVVLGRVLLNSGDSITLKFLVSQLGEVSVDGRIVGVKEMRERTARGTENWLRSFVTPLLAFGMVGLVFVGVILAVAGNALDSPQVALTGAMLIVWGFIVGGIGTAILVIVLEIVKQITTSLLQGR